VYSRPLARSVQSTQLSIQAVLGTTTTQVPNPNSPLLHANQNTWILELINQDRIRKKRSGGGGRGGCVGDNEGVVDGRRGGKTAAVAGVLGDDEEG
jgi:hypothetical protein